MKLSIILITVTLLFSICNVECTCSNGKIKMTDGKVVDIRKNTKQIDSILLDFALNKFVPNNEQLSKCIPYELDTFLNSLGANNLHHQQQFKKFLSIIFLKMLYYHIRYFNNGVELKIDNNNSSKILINEYNKLLKKNQPTVNSSTVMDFVNSQPDFENDSDIISLKDKIGYLVEHGYNTSDTLIQKK